MRLLVTGGAGFIGHAVVADALAAGWQVRVLDSLRADVHGAHAGGRSAAIPLTTGDGTLRATTLRW